MFPVPTAPHALHLPTPQSGTSPYQRVGANHSPLGWGRVPGELMLPASPGWSLGACLPPAAPPGGPSALRGEDRGEPPQLTPAHPRSLTLTLGDWASPGSLVPCRMLVSETTCSSWASATLFYSTTHPISRHPLDLRPPALLSHPSNHRGGRKLPPFRQVKVCSLSVIFD